MNDKLDLAGLSVATSLVSAPAWYDHLAYYIPGPTTVYGVLGSIFLLVQIADKLGLLPDVKRRKRDSDDHQPD